MAPNKLGPLQGRPLGSPKRLHLNLWPLKGKFLAPFSGPQRAHSIQTWQMPGNLFTQIVCPASERQ